MKKAFIYFCYGILIFAFSHCQQKIPTNTFDIRADSNAQEASFEKVQLKGKIPPKYLKVPSEPYLLGPGDVLDIEVAEVPDTLAKTFVMPDGMVYYNLAGGVRAEGLTTIQFSKALEKALRRDYTNPSVNVSLVDVQSRRYWILGRVFGPGLYPLQQPTTLLEAISRAGGLYTAAFSGQTEELADLPHSIIVRDGKIIPVDFEKLIRSGDTSQNIYLRHNDYIYLPSSTSATVLTLGKLVEPQAVPYRPSLTVIECIARCRGPIKGAHLDQVVIVRGSLKNPQAAVVNVKNILTGKEPNVLVKAGDIVWVPKKPFRLLEDTVRNVFQNAARTLASTEGSSAAGGDQDPVLSVPLGNGP